MARCGCTAAEAAGITKDPWHTQPHPQPATLVTIDQNPFVGETPMDAIQNWITPNNLYYARNHFETPSVDVNQWTLGVDGHIWAHLCNLSYIGHCSRNLLFKQKGCHSREGHFRWLVVGYCFCVCFPVRNFRN